ncbi:MAG: SCO family protein [Gammaproteobacteria bacterium]
MKEQENIPRNKSIVPLVSIGLSALLIGIWSATQLLQPQPLPETQAVTLISAPRALPEFTMVNKDGQETGPELFQDKWSLVFMGFTSCGHVCPTKMVEMRMIHDEVEEPLQVVFLSVDPNRDTPEAIKQYVEGFDSSFTGITGDEAAIESFANTVGAPYFVDTTPGKYVVDHSSALFVIGPDASLVGVVTPPLDINLIASDLNQLM